MEVEELNVTNSNEVLQGINVVNVSLEDRLQNLEVKDTLYLHIAHLRKKDTDKGIFACAFYTNKEGSNRKSLVGQSISQEVLKRLDVKSIALESYNIALNLVYSLQNVLYSCGIENIHIVTDNNYLYKVVKGNVKDSTGLLSKIENKYLNIYGAKYISLNVILDTLVDKSKARKYCSDKYLNLSDLKINNLNNKVNKRNSKTKLCEGSTIDELVNELSSLDIKAILNT